MSKTVIKTCVYNEIFSLQYDVYEGHYILSIYYNNGDENRVRIEEDMLRDLGELGEAVSRGMLNE